MLLMLIFSCNSKHDLKQKQVNSNVVIKYTQGEYHFVTNGFIVDSLFVTTADVYLDFNIEYIHLMLSDGSVLAVEPISIDVHNDLLVLKPIDQVTFNTDLILSTEDLKQINQVPEYADVFRTVGTYDGNQEIIEGHYSKHFTSDAVLTDSGHIYFDIYEINFPEPDEYHIYSGSLFVADNSFGVSVLADDDGTTGLLIPGSHVLNLLDSSYKSDHIVRMSDYTPEYLESLLKEISDEPQGSVTEF
jgi:hypothetical protein